MCFYIYCSPGVILFLFSFLYINWYVKLSLNLLPLRGSLYMEQKCFNFYYFSKLIFTKCMAE